MQTQTQTVTLIDAYYKSSELYAVLSDGTTTVKCENITYLDLQCEEMLQATFEEWCELAKAGVKGYTMLTLVAK